MLVRGKKAVRPLRPDGSKAPNKCKRRHQNDQEAQKDQTENEKGQQINHTTDKQRYDNSSKDAEYICKTHILEMQNIVYSSIYAS